MRHPFGAFLASLLVIGCQSVAPPLSLQDAKKVAAEFGGAGFVPPPRTIFDITSILDRQEPDATYRSEILARLDRPPNDTAPATLSTYYRLRADAALQLGLTDQALDEARQSVRYARESNQGLTAALEMLGASENMATGMGVTTWREAYENARSEKNRYFVIQGLRNLGVKSASEGDFVSARRMSDESDRTLAEMRSNNAPESRIALAAGLNAQAHGDIAMSEGRYAEAEQWQRKAIASWRIALQAFSDRPDLTTNSGLGLLHRTFVTHLGNLSENLLAQDRAAEAEAIAREALLYALQHGGGGSPDAAIAEDRLAQVLFWEGRPHDAELLFSAEVRLRDAAHLKNRNAQNHVADSIAMQGRWGESLARYVDAEQGTVSGVTSREYTESTYISFPRILALYHSDQTPEGLSLAQRLADHRTRTYGRDAPDTALARGFVGAGLALQGDRASSLIVFQAIAPQLLQFARDDDQSAGQGTLIQEYRRYVLEAYLRLLLESGSEAPAASDVAIAFQVADSLRSAVTQDALTAAAARSSVRSPELRDLSRREQDAQQQINARLGIVANILSQPVEHQNAQALVSVRAEVESLRAARAVLRQQIEKRFPPYASLVNPAPASIEQARAVLDNDEALVALYVGERESYVWTVRHNGPVAFAVIPLGNGELADMAAQLRNALDPNAKTVGEIPLFDVALAHKLYSAILEPVRAEWRGAKSLIVASYGPLAQIPFSLLVMRPTPQPGDQAALFSRYQHVSFVIREVAVTQVPSVAALAILRGTPPADPGRRAFVGFGDPWFSEQQAAQARSEPAQQGSVATRGFQLRAAPATKTMSSATIGALPRLADTAEEVREVATSLHADPATDVFLGPAANEWQVRNMKLDDRRVVMFATHGLVPGDLDGLVQPALALSAPSVAKVDGDGLLTMDKILGLKLDADWVVLSACNTAAGDGAGAEAVSGLGRAFFYAGARALLVTNWPVETTSARKLTTTVFQRQAAEPSLSRAEALRQSMLSLIDGPGAVDPGSGRVLYSYAHPIFWAPFSLVGDGR